ncbi:zinc-dependent metalloprotease [Candidatus Palauibacter sp.]|uniref:zinc-dependent metalloprotease n=1 Tax=Candidatus Palauibacter sp. TaxID=3101350 RepID=UPI003AF23ED6
MTCFRLRLIAFLLFLIPASTAAQDSGGGLPSIEEKTASMRAIDGFVPMYWEASSGKLWLEISRWETDILHMTGLASGLGSNDIGLDRGALAGSRLVRFQRVGPKVLLIQPNLDFRASSPNPREVQAVTDAFAPSTLWGFTAAAETDGRVLVDATDFVVRDMINWAQRLRPGTYRFDASRSAVHLPMTMGFPENTEIEASLTFVRQPGAGGGGFGGFGGGGGAFEGVGNVASTGEAATIRLHHSFVQLPELGEYTPRAFDPRAGFGAMSFADYSAPLGEDMRQRFIRRHRLEKRDPSAAASDPVEPIVYYLDAGAPEPIRTALLEGARWWNQAFEAAGFRDGFQVEMLPEGVSSHDVRYNVINWVHRSTRGWSTGGSVTDPRTGEILKGVVTLGSLRWRQDYLIAEGLLSPYANGDEVPGAIAEWALARIRQLSAHEVGHTLGLGHNYYDSSRGRISVLDYPHPLVTLGNDGRLDYSEVYDVDIGEWDKVAITYGYSDFPPGTDETAELRRILDEAWDEDIIYFTNQDIGIHARADQWSNGVDAAAELDRMMEVRRHALDRFGEAAIRAGRPIVTVEEALVPLYMHHRYQVDAAASMLGGLEYIYAFRGDGRTPMRRVSGDAQRAALAALAATLRPAELAIPAGVLDLLPPRPPGFGRSRETFPRYTGPAFDAVTPAVVAADHTISRVLQPARAARLVEQHALDPELPGLDEVLIALVDGVRPAANETPYHTELRLAAYRVLVDRIMALAEGAPMPHVRAIATHRLVELRAEMAANPPPERDAAFVHLVDRDIERFLDKPSSPYEMPGTPNAPPGAPIGQPAMDWLAGEAWTAAGPAGWATRWLGISPVCEADRGGF